MADYLYIHVPFCVKKCVYCDFLSFSFDEQAVADYTAALCGELALRQGQAGELKTVYIGGGTPSLMPERFFDELFSCLRSYFSICRDPEISVEANPGTLTYGKLQFLLSLGVNRISIGVQSFHDSELETLGRIHTSRDAAAALELAVKAGVRNISIDLMYGIPGQTSDTWKDTLRKAVASGPVHISSYELTPEKDTPLHRSLADGSLVLPDEDTVVDMYRTGVDYLASCGFEHYEISNYARASYACRHNLNYWNRSEYIGAGAGAHSFFAGRRSRNTRDLRVYLETLARKQLPEEESATVFPKEAMRELIFLGLRKTEGIRLSEAASMGLDVIRSCGDLLSEGYLEEERGFLRLSEKGLVLSNQIIVRIFADLNL